MTTFFTSDWHLHHSKILQYCPYSRKGNTPEEMTKLILEGIADQVKPGDTIYNIGDVSFGTEEQTYDALIFIRNKLRVNHHLVLGNHDHKLRKSDRLRFLFNSVQDVLEVSIDKQLFVLSHFQMSTWNKAHYGAIHIHGHSHSGHQTPGTGKFMDVGIDTRQSGDMRMYTLDEVKNILSDESKIRHH